MIINSRTPSEILDFDVEQGTDTVSTGQYKAVTIQPSIGQIWLITRVFLLSNCASATGSQCYINRVTPVGAYELCRHTVAHPATQSGIHIGLDLLYPSGTATNVTGGTWLGAAISAVMTFMDRLYVTNTDYLIFYLGGGTTPTVYWMIDYVRVK